MNTNFDFTGKTIESLTAALDLYRGQYEDGISRGDLDVANYAHDVCNAIRAELARRETPSDVVLAADSDEALIESLAVSPGFTEVEGSDHLAELLGFTDQDAAIQALIVEPIEAGVDENAYDSYDVAAIAAEVLGDSTTGYALTVEMDEFWQIVEKHAYEADAATHAAYISKAAEHATAERVTAAEWERWASGSTVADAARKLV